MHFGIGEPDASIQRTRDIYQPLYNVYLVILSGVIFKYTCSQVDPSLLWEYFNISFVDFL